VTTVMLACRVLHIAATCTSLGGLFYARMVLWPTLPLLPEPERESFLKASIRRYAYIKWSGVTVVAATGVVQWFYLWPHVSDQGLYVAYFALKMAGAVGLLTITALLALPVRKLEGMRERRAFWSALNILCGLTILVGAALMRTVVKTAP
jgi:uncharacterized membrane protein